MTTDVSAARPRERIPASLRTGGTAAPTTQPPVPDRTSDRPLPPSAGPVASPAAGRSGRPTSASPAAGRSTRPADASRRFVASVSVIATLLMVGAMARSAAAQQAADAAAAQQAADAAAAQNAVTGPAGFPAPTAITVPASSVEGAAAAPAEVAPAPLPTAPAPRGTAAPPASKSHGS